MNLNKKMLATIVAVVIIISLGAFIFSKDKTPEVSRGSGSTETTFNLKLGHNMAEDHTVHISMTAFAKDVAEKSNGSINITVFPNGTLGSESDMLSQIQNKALDMAKVSASTMGNFSTLYNAYSVPYVFNDKDHYYNVMGSEITQNIFDSTQADGFIGLTWLDSGSRSFYTKNKPIRIPADLKGLKIRTMDSQMAINMMNAMGGSATVMGYSDIYTAIQSGVIDGAENNVTALRDHGEVAKYYSFDEHTRIPDIVVISASVWEKLSDSQKDIIKNSAKAATENYKAAWAEFEETVLANVTEKFGVELIRDVDIAAFQEAVQPVYEGLKTKDPAVYGIVEQIRVMAN